MMAGLNTVAHLLSGVGTITGEHRTMPNANPEGTSISFREAFASALGTLEEGEKRANDAVVAFAGGAPLPLHEILIQAEEAQLNLALAVEVRNKAVEAYQEIMRMPV